MIRQILRSFKPVFTAVQRQRFATQQVATEIKNVFPGRLFNNHQPDFWFIPKPNQFVIHENLKRVGLSFSRFFAPRSIATGLATAGVLIHPPSNEGILHRLEALGNQHQMPNNNLSDFEEILNNMTESDNTPFTSLAALTAQSRMIASSVPMDWKRLIAQVSKQSKKIVQLQEDLSNAQHAIKTQAEENSKLSQDIELLKIENEKLRQNLFEIDNAKDLCIICAEKIAKRCL